MSNKQKRKSRATIHDMDQEHKVGKKLISSECWLNWETTNCHIKQFQVTDALIN